MRLGPKGYEPHPGHLEELLRGMPELRDPSVPEFVLVEWEPLLDSADNRPSDWQRIAREVAARYDEIDGVVVLHGTDTMAYSASALSFLLDGLAKPVILTGSQVPLAKARSDARENLIASLQLAAHPGIHEVCVYFAGKILRGNRSTKVSSSAFTAFDSPNEAPLGHVGAHIELRHGAMRPPGEGPLRVAKLGDVTVAALRLFPGIDVRFLEHALLEPLQGLVLETYGAGNAPSRDREFIAALQLATERGVVIVNTTQCLEGRVDMRGYATGSSLLDAGVTSGADMTPEAALAKLIYLLGVGHAPARVRELMEQDLKGELTPPG